MKIFIPRRLVNIIMGEHNTTLEERAYEALGPPQAPLCSEKIPRGELKELRRMGYSIAACAKFYGVSRPTIYKILGGVVREALEMIGSYGYQTEARERLKKRAIRDYRKGLGGATTEEP